MNRKQFIGAMGLGALSIPKLMNGTPIKGAYSNLPSTESWEQIQKQFKVLRKHIYMNNGTMGITPNIVLRAIEEAFDHTASEGHYSSDFLSLQNRLANILGVDSTTLAITKNVTEGVNIACWGQTLFPGDEVLMTKHEHVSGCLAWLYRARNEGIRIKTFNLGKTAEETLSNFKKAISPKTKIVAIPHIPCTMGQILPVRDICTEARKQNIISIIDGAHPLGMIRFNISEIDCDYYAGCLHKWLLAPLGLGYIYIRKERLEQTKIHNLGAYSIEKFDMMSENPKSDNLVSTSQRFSPGTFCEPLYKAGIKAIDWYELIGIERVEKRVKELSLFAHEELEKLNKDIEILSPKEEKSRSGITTFRLINRRSIDFINFARNAKESFVLRHVHEAKIDGIRLSTHYYNDFIQIEKLMTCIYEFIKK